MDDKDINILLQNPELHAIKPRKPKDWLRTALKMNNTGKPQRLFVSLDNAKINSDGTMTIEIPLPKEVQEQWEKLQAQGQTIKFHLPEGGLPIYLSKDAKEKQEADERKKKK